MTIEILSLNFHINDRVKKVGKHFLNEATENEVSYHKFQWDGQYLGSLITPQKYVRERWPVTITKGEEGTHKRKKRQREKNANRTSTWAKYASVEWKCSACFCSFVTENRKKTDDSKRKRKRLEIWFEQWLFQNNKICSRYVQSAPTHSESKI